MLQSHFPTPAELESWQQKWREASLSYLHHGGVQRPPKHGFLVDHHSVKLGEGAAIYTRACEALDTWVMFPSWARIHARSCRPQPGDITAMITRILGLWWVNPCRILNRLDGPRRHGFVYGTLPDHAECGEECFLIEHRPDDSVWYEILAFSRPRHPLTWIGFPIARWWQMKFVRDSQACMQSAVA